MIFTPSKRAFGAPLLTTLTMLATACAADGADDGLSSERAALVVPPSGVGSPGYTTSWWHFAASGAFDSLEQRVIPVYESPVDAFYFATNFYFHGQLLVPQPGYGAQGYMGLQDTPDGKIAIFSIWGAAGATSPGTARPFSGEGTGYQTFISYPWSAGTAYELRVTHTSAMYGAGLLRTAWSAYVRDLNSGEEQLIGTILVPYTFGKLTNLVADFTEYFGETRLCSEFLAMDPTRVVFTRPTGNGGAVHNDTPPYSQTIETNRADRPTCDGAASYGVSSSGDVYAVHRMFGSE